MNMHGALRTLTFLVLLVLFTVRTGKWILSPSGGISLPDGWDLRGLWDLNNAVLHRVDPYPLALSATCFMPTEAGLFCNPPVNTPLFWLITSPIALLDWSGAVFAWFLVNIISAIVIVYLIETQMLPQPIRSKRLAILALLFFASAPLSSAISIGQTTVLIFLMALAGFFALRKRQLLAGVLIGLALSKYSLVFPILMFLLLDRRFVALAVAVAMQLIGVLVFCFVVGTPLDTFLTNYFRLASIYIASPTEFNLHSRFVEWGLSPWIGLAYDLAGVIVTFGVIFLYVQYNRHRSWMLDKVVLLPLLFAASLPFVYHRLYDGMVLILLAAPLLWDQEPDSELCAKSQVARYSLILAALLAATAFLIPRVAAMSASTLAQTLIYLADSLIVLLVWLVLIFRTMEHVNLPVAFRRARAS
jgi:hypothetical protein